MRVITAWSGACVLALVLAAWPAAAGSQRITVSQGTDFTVTAARDGTLLFDVAGRLWRLPAAGGEALPITPEHELANRPAVAPDGHAVAYQALRQGFFQILLTDLDSGETRQLTSGPWHHLAPAWSADGRHLALACNRSGDFGIWELDPDTLTLKQLTFEPGSEHDPAWNPQDGALAYVRESAEGRALIVRTPAGSSRTVVRARGRLQAPAWRPDGSLISYVAETTAGPRLHMVILSEPPVIKLLAPGESAFPAPAIWPDRDHLIYTADGQIRQRDFALPQARVVPFQAVMEIRPADAVPTRRLPEPGTRQPARTFAGFALLPDGRLIAAALGDLWELSPEGKPLQQLTNDDWIDRDPATSTDGKLLAFTSDRNTGSTRIWVRDLATGMTRALPRGGSDPQHPAWSADGKRLAFLETSDTGGRFSLRVHDLASATTSTLATDIRTRARPAWSPDGTRIALLQEGSAGSQLLLVGTERNGTRRRITLPAQASGATTAEVQWSPDGRQVLLASAAGIRLLPVLDNGLIGAETTVLHDGAVDFARWLPDARTVVFSHGNTIGHVEVGAAAPRLSTVALGWDPPAVSGRTVIRAGRVFDGLGNGYLFDQDVIIEGRRIVAVQPSTPEPRAAGVQWIDARHQTVLPGLIDTAVQFDSATESAGRRLLAWGITTVQAIGPASGGLSDLGEYWLARGAGPHLLHAPSTCTGDTRTTDTHSTPPADALRVCAGTVGDLAAAPPSSAVPLWSDDWLTALSGRVAVIGPGSTGIHLQPATPRSGLYYQDAIDIIIHSGVALISGLTGQALPLLASQHADLLQTPQYRALYPTGSNPHDRHEASRPAARQMFTQRLRQRQRMLAQIGAGGGRIIAGSGTTAAVAGATLHAELRWLVQAGFTPAEVLRMTTSEAARSLGLQEDLGAIQPGHLADLLIVTGDPLVRPGDLAHIDRVMIGGRIHTLEALIGSAAALEKFTPSSRE